MWSSSFYIRTKQQNPLLTSGALMIYVGIINRRKEKEEENEHDHGKTTTLTYIQVEIVQSST